MSDEPVLPRSPNAKHAATDGENLTDIGLHYHLSCHGGVICTGPDCRTVRRPNQSSGIIGAVDCGAGAIERHFLDALTHMAEWARTLSYAGLD
jgi:hypothetical protein